MSILGVAFVFVIGFLVFGAYSWILFMIFSGRSCYSCKHYAKGYGDRELCTSDNFADEPLPIYRMCLEYRKKCIGVCGE